MRITPETTAEQMLAHIKTPNKHNLYNSEARFQRAVEGYMLQLGWISYHTWDSRRSHEGFPDLTAWRGDQLIFAELKLGPRSKLSLAQWSTLAALSLTPNEVYLWLPWEDEILDVLSLV